MKAQNRTIAVAVCLLGANLDPDLVSEELGINPTLSRRKGDRRSSANGREILTKMGVWELGSSSQSPSISEHLDQVLSATSNPKTAFTRVSDIEDAFFDIFVAAVADGRGGGTCEFEMSAAQIESLGKLGLPVRFTVAVVKESVEPMSWRDGNDF
jgi:hypothetical protein